MIRLATLLAGLAFATGALAHKASDSYLSIDATKAPVAVRWDIALRDLDLAVGLDADGDGRITWGELRAAREAVDRYALSRLVLRDDAGVCPFRAPRHAVEDHTDGAYDVLSFEAECAGAPNAAVQVDYTLLFDRDAQHRGIVKVVAATGAHSFVATAEAHVHPVGGGPQRGAAFLSFLRDGVRHIALGFDHILFLVVLLLPAVMVRDHGRWRPADQGRTVLLNVLGIVTAFTAAHSLTLTLGALRVVSLPSRLVESAIALSVVLAAIDNVRPFLPRRRWQVAFAFGLVHGLGFASVLLDLDLPSGALALSLLGFNLGVEAGQLALVAVLLPLIFVVRRREAYRRVAIGAGSVAIAFVAGGWLAERALGVPFMPF